MLIINLLGVAAICAIAFLALVFTYNRQKIQEQQAAISNLRKSLDEMDNQAKLIVRTDMELNKTQEALDKRMASLYALQSISRAISTTLEEEQIFSRIQNNHIEGLGFEKALVFLADAAEKKPFLALNIGYSPEALEKITSFIASDEALCLNLLQGEPKGEKTASSFSLNADAATKEHLNDIFKVRAFVLSPVLPKEGNKGFLFVGTDNADAVIAEGDEELITILANQLGQALENARLFDKTWQAQQGLEKKVEEKTRQLSQALEEVQKASKRKSEFVSSVSHELRTPLTSIKGYAAILASGQLGNIAEDARLRIEKINRRSDELVQFINDLLDISRIESGKVTMKQEPQELNKIIEDAADTLSVLMKEKQIVFSVEIPKEKMNISVDYLQIKRVFINLVNNAIKYTPEKGKISIQAKKSGNGKEAQVDVTDSGCGMPEEAQGKLFQEFYRVDMPINQQVKGTGLGLALVKNIVEAHKGKIWVTSKLDSGSTFSFTLPLTG